MEKESEAARILAEKTHKTEGKKPKRRGAAVSKKIAEGKQRAMEIVWTDTYRGIAQIPNFSDHSLTNLKDSSLSHPPPCQPLHTATATANNATFHHHPRPIVAAIWILNQPTHTPPLELNYWIVTII